MGLMHKAQLQLLLEFLLVPNVQVIKFCWEKQTKPNQTQKITSQNEQYHKKYINNKMTRAYCEII